MPEISEIKDESELRRDFLFRPCESKEELHDWILTFIGLDLPDCVVDSESTSCPMDMVWEVYSKVLAGDDESFRRVIYYASRDSFKTLAASVLEVLVVLHANCDVGHMAAISEQAIKCQEYVKRAFRRPYLRDFIEGDNERLTKLVRYYNPNTGHSLTRKEYLQLLEEGEGKGEYQEQVRVLQQYIEKDRYIKVVICTMQGANSLHVRYFCVDGDTGICVRNNSKEAIRLRKYATARGLFRRLDGGNYGGRPGSFDEGEKLVSDPKSLEEVLSFNPVTSAWEFVPIVSAYRSKKERVEVVLEDGKKLVCTEDHPIFVAGRGFTVVGDVEVGDGVFIVNKAKANRGKGFSGKEESEEVVVVEDRGDDEWEQVLLGGLLGDCGIYKKPSNNPYIQEQHCMEQKDYLRWKQGILSRKLRMRDTKGHVSGYTGAPQVGFSSGNTPLLLPYRNFRKDFVGLEKLGPMGLAVWYMDGGSTDHGIKFCTCSFTKEQNEILVRFLKDRFSIEVEVKEYGGYFYLMGGVEAKRKLSKICAPFIHPDMAYKFDVSGNKGQCRVCGKSFWFYEMGKASKFCGDIFCRAVEKHTFSVSKVISVSKCGEGWVYDFTLEKNHNYISNGFLSHNCCDEIDVVTNPAAYDESKAIPAGRAGKLPITVLISTRKTAFGLVQKEIDDAEKTGLKIRHFNILDVTQACEPKRHKPDLPKIKLWSSSEELRHVNEQTYSQMNFKEREGFVELEAFAGCSKCKLFSCCRTRLATHQKSKSILLKPIPEVIGKFKDWSVETAQSQLLCKKPSSTGLIYGRFDRTRHILSPAQCYAKVFGELPPNPKEFTKAMLMVAMEERGADWYGGTDWGSTHNFSYVHGFKDGNVLFVTHCISVPELDPDQMLAIVEPLKKYDPTVWPDTADPKMNKWFKKKGWRYQLKWNKGAGTVVGGIGMVRAKLNPPMSGGVPELYFIHDIDEDDMMDLLINHLAEYHWKLDVAGKPSGIPDDKNDDENDALRYLVMNLFVGAAGLSVGTDNTEESEAFLPSEPMSGYYDKDHWMQQIISQNTGQPMDISPPKERRMVISSQDGKEIDIGSYYEQQNKPKKEDQPTGAKKGRKGRLSWDF